MPLAEELLRENPFPISSSEEVFDSTNLRMMNSMSSKNRHGQKSKQKSIFQQLISIHWWMASLYLFLVIEGVVMDRWPAGFHFRQSLYSFQKSIGILTVVLLIWRLFVLVQVWWRKYCRRFPKLTVNWFKKTLLHSLLYVCMAIAPATGVYLANSVRAGNVRFFGIPLPDFFSPNQAVVDLAGDLHVWSISAFFGLFLLHLASQWRVLRSQWKRFKQCVGK